MTIDWKKRVPEEKLVRLSPVTDPALGVDWSTTPSRDSIAVPWLTFGVDDDTGISFSDKKGIAMFVVDAIRVEPAEWIHTVVARKLLSIDEAVRIADALYNTTDSERGSTYEPLTYEFKGTTEVESVEGWRTARSRDEAELLRSSFLDTSPSEDLDTLAEVYYYSFSVYVKTSEGNPVHLAQVDVKTVAGKTLAYGMTDENGVYQCPDGIPPLIDPSIILTVQADGFYMMRTEPDIVEGDNRHECFLTRTHD